MMQLKATLDYCNKLILAPMVRGSRLPVRMLALRYGADLVYTDEMIDLSLLMSKRRINDALGTVDYINEANGYVTFRTSPLEKSKLVFQIGTSNAERAVAFAKLVQNDVSAIDVNMGCPKSYSTSGGMGAALLSRPDNAKDILRNLVNNIPLPITCKIRIFDDVEASVKLAKEFESTGISAIAVHGRTRNQRSKDPVNKETIQRIAENLQIPVIANGGSDEIENFDDIQKFKENCGATSVMIARAAQKNVSIFRKEGLLPLDDLIPEYLKLCVDFDNSVSNTQYTIQKMHKYNDKKILAKFSRAFEDAETLEQICHIWKMDEYCRQRQSEYYAKGHKSLPCSPQTHYYLMPSDLLEHRKKYYTEENITFSLMNFDRKYFSFDTLPKVLLHRYAGQNKLPLPVYETRREDRLYYSVITFEGKKYSSLVWDREKKHAEQNAALVCVHHLGLLEEDYLKALGCLYT